MMWVETLVMIFSYLPLAGSSVRTALFRDGTSTVARWVDPGTNPDTLSGSESETAKAAPMTIMFMYITGLVFALALILWTRRQAIGGWLRRVFGGQNKP